MFEDADWKLDNSMPHHVPNARIVQAWLIAAMLWPRYAFNVSDAFMVSTKIAPAFASVTEELLVLARRAIQKHGGLPAKWLGVEMTSDECPTSNGWNELICLATSGDLNLAPILPKVLRNLSTFLARNPHPNDASLEHLKQSFGLDAEEVVLLELAAAFAQGTIDRDVMEFVNGPVRHIKLISRLSGSPAAQVERMLNRKAWRISHALLPRLKSHGRCGMEDLLELSLLGEQMLTAPRRSSAELTALVITPLPALADNAPVLDWRHLTQEREVLSAVLQSAAEQRKPGVNILIHGAPGTGKTALVQELLTRDLDVVPYMVTAFDGDDTAKEASRTDRLNNLHVAQKFAANDAANVIVLDEAQDVFQGLYGDPFLQALSGRSESKAWVNQMLETNRHPVIWISNDVSHMDPAYLRRFTLCLEFPRPPLALRRQMATTALEPLGCSPAFIESLAQTPSGTPALMASTAAVVKLAAAGGVAPDVAGQLHVKQHLRATGQTAPNPVAAGQTRFDARYLNLSGAASAEQIQAALRSNPRCTLLFSGPPGTGKTQFASELATQLNRHLVVRTASDIKSRWFGGSERNVARLFREADPATEILFLDEAEVLLAERTGARHEADQSITAEFLRWLEVYEGVFICATNHASAFDAALARRFVFKLEFKPLSATQRRQMYAQLALGAAAGSTRKLPAAAARRLDTLDGLTPGDFANVARRVRMLGLQAKHWLDELTQEHAAKGGGGRPIGFL